MIEFFGIQLGSEISFNSITAGYTSTFLTSIIQWGSNNVAVNLQEIGKAIIFPLDLIYDTGGQLYYNCGVYVHKLELNFSRAIFYLGFPTEDLNFIFINFPDGDLLLEYCSLSSIITNF